MWQDGSVWATDFVEPPGFLKATLADLAVHTIYSPPRRPQYNRACERHNGLLKVQTRYAAALAGRPD